MSTTGAVASSSDPPTDRRAPGPQVFQLTCGLDGRAHLATVSSVDVAIVEERGRFNALCGHEIDPAALRALIGAACGECQARPHRRPDGCSSARRGEAG